MLGTLTASIIRFAGAHHEIAYGLVLLAALAEALPVIGAFVPGDVIILGVSAVVPTGALRFWPLVAAATVGAVLGDGVSFGFGARYRRTILSRWPLKRYPALIARGEAFQRRHGGKSVFVARFTPGVRAIVPVLGGVLQMSVARFFAMNVLSAIVWAPAHVLAGVAIGASFVLLGAVAGRLALIVALLLVLLAALVWGTRLAVQRLPARAASIQEQLWRWARARESWITRPLLSILDPARKELPGLALLGALLVASVWLFLGVLQDVLAGDPLVRANEAVFHFLQSLRTDWIDQIMVTTTELSDATVVAATAAAALLWFAWRRNGRAAAHALAAVLGASLFSLLLKVVLRIPRPYPLSGGWDAFSFPSGHTVASAALYGFLAIVTVWEVRAHLKVLVTSVAAVLIGVTAFSRVYLGVHWLSDVLAGIAFGLAWAVLLAIGYLRRNPPPVGAAGLCTVVGVTFAAAGALHVDHRHTADMRLYARREPQQVLPWATWWHSGWSQLPSHRIDLAGSVEAPLTFQWAGSLTALRVELSAKGWQPPVPWTARSALEWLDPHAPISALPVLPHLQNGHREALVMVRALSGAVQPERLVLQLWRSDLRVRGLAAAAVPVFVGTVLEERMGRLVSILTVTHRLPDYDGPRNALGAAIRFQRLAERPLKRPQQGWDGGVLLARSAGT